MTFEYQTPEFIANMTREDLTSDFIALLTARAKDHFRSTWGVRREDIDVWLSSMRPAAVPVNLLNQTVDLIMRELRMELLACVKIAWVADSSIGEFDCDGFSGRYCRVPARKEGWHHGEHRSAEAAYHEVSLRGIHGAYAEIRMNTQRGRGKLQAVKTALSCFVSPEDIVPATDGTFRTLIDLR